jgi:DNA-binding NarL/FixJ family response regulator
MIEDLQILSVGPAALCDIVRNALHDFPHCEFVVAADHRQLWVTPREQPVDIAILHCTLSGLDLEDAGRLIRRQWPNARILALRSDREYIENALCDERLAPTEPPAVLLAAIERLMADCGARRTA